MILFQSDIDKERPIIDWDTPNDSFLRICMVLKRMGIKNHLFPLVLYQKDLIGVDPHRTDLTDTQKAMILLECKTNPWYFFRVVMKAPRHGGDYDYFIASRGNIAAIWAFMNDVDFGLVMPRQTGKTFCTCGIFVYYLFILAQHVRCHMFTKDDTLRAESVQRIKELRDGMPKWMYKKHPKEFDRREAVSNFWLDNQYHTFAGANDPVQAYKLGRGSSCSLAYYDETSYMSYNWIIIPSSMNAMLAASAQVRKNGIPSPAIYTTTAGNPDSKVGRFALSIFESAAPFAETMYDLRDKDELIEVIDRNSTRRMLYMEFSAKALGFDEQWIEDAKRRAGGSIQDFQRDILNMWVGDNDNAIIPPDMMEAMRLSRRDPSFTEIDDGFVIKWYVDRGIVESRRFQDKAMVMGMDTSENIGRDFTTFVIVDPKDLSTIATCRCNEPNVMQIARYIFKLLKKFPRLIWIPERQSTGASILDFVIEQLQNNDINPYLRIYNDVIQNFHDDKYKNVNIYSYRDIYGKDRGAFGFRTGGNSSKNSRHLLYKETMMKALELNHKLLYDKVLISEFCNLMIKNGRVDHPDGLHDDSVIAEILGCYLILFGRNLEMYGMKSEEVLSDVQIGGPVYNQEIHNDQVIIRRRIRELEDLLARQPVNMLRDSYRRELEALYPLVNDIQYNIQPISVTQVERQEREIDDRPRGATVSSIQAFSNRWNNIWRR